MLCNMWKSQVSIYGNSDSVFNWQNYFWSVKPIDDQIQFVLLNVILNCNWFLKSFEYTRRVGRTGMQKSAFLLVIRVIGSRWSKTGYDQVFITHSKPSWLHDCHIVPYSYLVFYALVASCRWSVLELLIT